MIDKIISVPPILVLGVGNLLMKDEGVGVHAALKLLHMPLPPFVEIIDGGTAGLDLLSYLENREKVIIIDAVQTNEPPGTIFRLTPDNIGSLAREKQFSLHQPGVAELLRIAQTIGLSLPEVVILAVQPADISIGTDLSPSLEEKLPRLIQSVLNEIETH